MHVLGTRVPRRLGVARSASSPKAALALGCSLTPGLRISFGRVTCMARAASVPGLWALGFLLLACVCGWVRVAVGCGLCSPLPVVAGVLGGCAGPGSRLCPALVGWVVGGFCVFFFFFRCWLSLSRAFWSVPPSPFFRARLLAFFFFFSCFGAPFPGGALFLACCCRFWPGGPPVPLWGSCLRCPLGGGFVPFCVVGGRFGGCGLFCRTPLPPPPLFFFFFFLGGRPGCSSLCLPSAGARSVAGGWCGWSLATPGGGSCVLLPATPGWVSLAVLVGDPRHSWLGSAGGGGVWRWCVGGVVAGVWCGWSLATPGGGSCVLLPATPGWVSLPAVVGGPRHSWLGSAGGVGVWRWCVGGVVAGVWCGWSLATPGGGSCVLLPATPGWVSLPVLVGGPRHSWLGFRCRRWCAVCGGGVLVGLWLVCRVVGPSPLLAEVPVCYSPPLLAGFRCRWWWAVPATPGWGPLAALVCGVRCVAVVCWWGCGWCVVWLVPRHSWRRSLCAGWVSLPVLVGGPRHSWLGSAGGVGVWCVVCGVGVLVGLGRVCGVVGPSPLLAVVPVCYSPPLLAGFRCRWWWAVPATPGWGPLAALVCGVRCVAVVCCWGCGWCVVWLVPRHSWRRFLCATPRHSWLGFAAGVGGRSPPLLAGVRWRRWCAVCGGGVLVGLWLVCGVVGPSPLLAEVPVCYSPPLLAGFRCRCWWAVPATPGWGPLAAVVCGVWLPGRVGRAGLPGTFWCASPFPSAALSFCFAWPPPGWGCPPLSRCCCRCFGCLFFFFFRPPAAWLSGRSRLVCVFRLAVGCSLVVAPPPPSPFVSRGFRRSCFVLWCFFFFFLLLLPLCAPVVSGFLWFPAPGALGLGACVFCFVGLPLLGSPCACPSFVLSAWLLAALWWLLPPPPFVSRGFRRCRSVLCAVLCCASLGAVLRRAAARFVARCCAVVCCVALVWCRCLLPSALRRCVLRCSFALCVFCRGAVVRAVCVLGCCAVRSLCSPLCAVLCFAVLVRSHCAVRVVHAVVGAWCCGALLCVVLFPVVCRGAVLGLVARGCLLVAFFGVGVPVWPRGLLPCGWRGLLWCPAFLCRVLLCCAVAWCCAVVLCCRVAVLLGLALPSCGLCFVVLLVGCAVFCPVVVSACCGALFLVPCVPCLLRSVRCGALLCWLWCPASLCRVLWRCAVVWCCAVVLCCPFAVLFVFALPSCGLSCGACVVCAVVGASCCGVSLCVVVSPWAFCGVVVLLWCVVVSCCAVRCPVVSCALCCVVRCCAALRCCAGWLCCAVVCAAGVCFSFCPLFLC